MDVEDGFVVVNEGQHQDRMDILDEDMVEDIDMDEADEMVGFVNQAVGFGPAQVEAGDSDNYSSASEMDGREVDSTFANVSISAILYYQPSMLGNRLIGPGPTDSSIFELTKASAVMTDLSHMGMRHRKEIPTFCLIRLPKSFVELYNIVSKVKGRDETGTGDDSDDAGTAETAICLLTGAAMRSGSPRASFSRGSRPPGTCTMHARKTSSGIGIFFLVQKCTVLLMHNNKSAYSPSLYVDEHGEEDPGLRRGRPLFLNAERYRTLELLWRNQGIPREVAQIRSTSDRVIRDNWY